MKKITFITVIALLAALFATPLMAAESKDYTIGGLWEFTASIPKTPVGESTISAAETGKIIINTVFKDDGEYIYNLKVSSKGSYTINGEPKTFTVDKDIPLPSPQKYTPGEPVYHTYTKDEYKEVMKLTQTGENELTGEMILYKNGKEVAKGKVKATRPTWKLAGKWNYTNKINGTCPTIGAVSATETGTMDLNMKSGDIEGKEYFDTLDVKYKTTYKIFGIEGTKEDEVKGLDISAAGLYNVGGIIYNEYKNKYGDVEHTQRIEFYQVAENKLAGKVYMIIGDQKTEIGTFEAIRITHPTWKLAGKWDYTANIPAFEVAGHTLSLEDQGSAVVKMKSGNIEGIEYFDSIIFAYNTTYTVDGQKYGPESDTETMDTTGLGSYSAGDVIFWEDSEEFGGIIYTQRVECYQVAENKIAGKVYIIVDGQKTEIGTIEATRNTGSSSSSGCNAGATAAMLLFCAVPMLFRRKK